MSRKIYELKDAFDTLDKPCRENMHLIPIDKNSETLIINK